MAARKLFVDDGKSGKEIAELLNISEKTFGAWAKKYGWKQTKNAKAVSQQQRLENIYNIIDQLAEERIKLSHQESMETDNAKLKETRERIAQIDAGVANWNKTLLNVNKQNAVNQWTLLQSIEIIFKQFDAAFPHLRTVSIEFQEFFINQIIPTFNKN